MNQLQKNVIENLGYETLEPECMEDLQNINNHGAAGGYGMFCYYHDTVKFYDDNREDIKALLVELADCMDIGMIELVKGFNCLNDNYSYDEIAEVIYNPASDTDSTTEVKNALTWFALEETAQQLVGE